MSSTPSDSKPGPPPLIKSVRLAGVGPFSFDGPQSKRDIELERLTLFVGPNSSGKSTILRAVGWLCDAAASERSWSWKKLSQQTQLFLNRKSSQLRVSLQPTGHREIEVRHNSQLGHKHVGVVARQGARKWLAWVGATYAEAAEELVDIEVLGSGVLPATEYKKLDLQFDALSAAQLTLNPDFIAAPSYFAGDVPEIRADGAYCASVLVELSLADRDRFDAVCDAIRTIIPDLRGIKFRREKASNGGATLWGHQLVLDMTSGEGIPAPAASEGTLLVIGLVTLLMASAEPPNILLIDDIDRALHPRAQAEVMALLRRLMDERPELQILATSHSPYLLDHVDASEVRVTSVDHQSGEAMCARLTEHPDFEKWREMMSPGEFWSAVGEDWVLSQQGDRG